MVDSRGLCPAGWKIPGENDWKTLEMYLGMPADEVNNLEWRGGDANVGGKLKADNGWRSPNTGATNESGFTALGSGARGANGTFFALFTSGSWWSSSEADTEKAWRRLLNNSNGLVYRHNYYKQDGTSVRCLAI